MNEKTIEKEGRVYADHTGFIYGEQTWGPLFAEGDGEPIPFTDNNAASYITHSLKILGLSQEGDLRGMNVLNIGTGREALIFQKLGADHVTHLDIARQNLENTQRYAKRMGFQNVSTIHGDVENVKLPLERYDLIFLAGIYQHIQTPARALVNLSRTLASGGRMYLGFFRSGEWKYFIVDAIRHLISRDLFSCVKNQIALTCSFGQKRHYQTTRMLDDFFVPCQHKFHPSDVIHDAQLVGLGVYHFDNDFREYQHEGNGYFSIGGDRIYLVKERPTPDLDPQRLQTVCGRHQLWDVPYQEEIILSNVDLIRKLKAYVDHGLISREDLAALVINLYRFTRPFDPEHDEYYQISLQKGRHQALQEFLTNVVDYFG